MSSREMNKSIKLNGQDKPLLAQFPVNSHFQIGIYQGSLSKYDILIKYRQLINGEWSRIRTPKHIHWTVDILIKQNEVPEATDKFLQFLLDYWDKVVPIKSDKERNDILDTEKLKKQVDAEAEQYTQLAEKGEYSVKFLILLAKLLMIQEKTNNHKAYMFKNLLEQLKSHTEIFSLISIATHR